VAVFALLLRCQAEENGGEVDDQMRNPRVLTAPDN
jgi:hypothetical protein